MLGKSASTPAELMDMLNNHRNCLRTIHSEGSVPATYIDGQNTAHGEMPHPSLVQSPTGYHSHNAGESQRICNYLNPYPTHTETPGIPHNRIHSASRRRLVANIGSLFRGCLAIASIRVCMGRQSPQCPYLCLVIPW